jgi:hypothetical protein
VRDNTYIAKFILHPQYLECKLKHHPLEFNFDPSDRKHLRFVGRQHLRSLTASTSSSSIAFRPHSVLSLLCRTRSAFRVQMCRSWQEVREGWAYYLFSLQPFFSRHHSCVFFDAWLPNRKACNCKTKSRKCISTIVWHSHHFYVLGILDLVRVNFIKFDQNKQEKYQQPSQQRDII